MTTDADDAAAIAAALTVLLADGEPTPPQPAAGSRWRIAARIYPATDPRHDAERRP